MNLTLQRDRVAWREGVDPGAQVGAADITEDTALGPHAPRNVLLDHPQLEMPGLIDARRLY